MADERNYSTWAVVGLIAVVLVVGAVLFTRTPRTTAPAPGPAPTGFRTPAPTPVTPAPPPTTGTPPRPYPTGVAPTRPVTPGPVATPRVPAATPTPKAPTVSTIRGDIAVMKRELAANRWPEAEAANRRIAASWAVVKPQVASPSRPKATTFDKEYTRLKSAMSRRDRTGADSALTGMDTALKGIKLMTQPVKKPGTTR